MISEYLIKKALYSDFALEQQRLDPNTGASKRQEIINEQQRRRYSGIPSGVGTGVIGSAIQQQPVRHEGAHQPEMPGVKPNPQSQTPIQRWLESRRNQDARMQPRQA